VGAAAHSTLFDFAYSGSLVNFTIPATDTYHILALGAQAGSGIFFRSSAPAVAVPRSAATLA
jgi:hypothetical protein